MDHISRNALRAKAAAPSPGGASERGLVGWCCCRCRRRRRWSVNCLTGKRDLCTGPPGRGGGSFFRRCRCSVFQVKAKADFFESDKWFVRVSATGRGAKCQGLFQPWAKGSATSSYTATRKIFRGERMRMVRRRYRNQTKWTRCSVAAVFHIARTNVRVENR